MKTYVVGGAVRDELLGLPVQDRDHVVVGSSPEEMVRLGFRPVGADFPVFLHPQTHEEYALARTERKTAPGYKGFTFHASPDVTLEDDLRRRDLTINAMARAENGELVDPHGGAADLKAGMLRHVSEAFAEDPVRILRVARFAARFGFAVAPETMRLMETMVRSGEADALVPERVWQELARGLMEKTPARMLAILRECGALARVLPELDATFSDPEVPERLARRLQLAASRRYSLPVRYAALLLDLEGDAAARLSERVNAPGDCRELARLAILERELLRHGTELDAETALAVMERSDAFRRPERLERLLELAECDAGCEDPPHFAPRRSLLHALQAVRRVDAGRVARENPADIAGALRRARLMAIAAQQPPSGH
ncbi:MAG TPA: multifunctional CCA tRNA nucleotidyl transferase/2'3'-cyclic phosphodiesterase/2'nucleotidase/phosphatase [Usitatibacter sp.]|nr:multifunctional CCA tRNA nucleotidyl transferase/2'3'-cyclic phosphodiesterase/2'nucleotidase/phosphatase [Usitatibacter sp.]